ncbi:MAG: oligosaccharide flippase family protein [Acidobacteriota bacterium]|nr:oligosaccharide flippase family protein [Acidobacteriota bacterium]
MLGRNIRLVFSTNVLMLCCGVVTSLLGAWALGPAGRGDLIVVLTWPGIFVMLMEIGLPMAYRYWTAKQPESTSAMFSNAVVLTLLIGFVGAGLAWMLIPHLIGRRSPEVVRLAQIYVVVIPMTLLIDLTRGLLEGARRFHWVAALRLVFFGVQLVSYVALWLDGRLTVATAVYTMIGATVVGLALALTGVWQELRPRWEPSLAQLKTNLRYGVRDYPGVLTEFVSWRLDLMMLVGMASSTSVGLYSIAIRLAEITAVLASSVGDALMPEVAASKKADEATKVVTRSLRMTLLCHLLILVPLCIAAPYILRFAYGSSFVPVTNVMRLLMLASVVWSAGAIVISGLNGLGHPGLSASARIAAALVMVVALLSWLPTKGIQGAALASLTGYSVMFLVALFWLLRRREITLWECLRPRWDDLPYLSFPDSFRSLRLRLGITRATNVPKPLVAETLE